MRKLSIADYEMTGNSDETESVRLRLFRSHENEVVKNLDFNFYQD
jgi:hypothetical protein